MKRYTPYFLVVVVFLIFAILIWQWHQSNRHVPQIYPDGISIEELTDDEQVSLLNGVNDYKEVRFEVSDAFKSEAIAGSVRYFIERGMLKFSAITQLPEEENVAYTVWIHPLNSDKFEKATTLELKKGGMLGSASFPENLLPVEIIISTTDKADEVQNHILLKTVIPAPERQSGT